jgi:hypothetical protein
MFMKNIKCPICNDINATCETTVESDGINWTWVTWQHNCNHCGYSVKKVTQDPYNFENVSACPIPGHQDQASTPFFNELGIDHIINEDVNKSELAAKIEELRVRLSQLETFERDALENGGVFISYSHADKIFVERLTQNFNQDGIYFWLDDKDLLLGQVIDKAISEGIQKNWVFVSVVTPSSVSSKWVERELDEALHEEIEGRKIVIAVVTGGLKHEDFPPRLRRKKYVNLSYDFDAGYQELKKSIMVYLKQKEQVDSEKPA